MYGKYRPLAAIQIFQNAEDNVPLKTELKMACHPNEEACITQNGVICEVEVHFPFIATCLVPDASLRSNEGYYRRVLVEPLGMRCNQKDDNNGITVIDITVPAHVRQGSVNLHGMESEREVQLMAPLTARTYLEAY